MKTEIKNKVKDLVNAHGRIKNELISKIKAWENDKVYSDSHKQQRIKELQQQAEQNDFTFNKQLIEIIAEEKKVIIGEPKHKPADYQVQISNALKFIELAGNKLSDEQAYEILKPFQGDYETMNLFQSAIGGLIGNGGVFNTFDKTFEKTNDFLMLINNFNAVEQTVNNIFDSNDLSLNGAVKLNMFMDNINTIDNLANSFES